MRWLGGNFYCAICNAAKTLPENVDADRAYICFDCAWMFRNIMYVHYAEMPNGEQVFWIDDSSVETHDDPLEP